MSYLYKLLMNIVQPIYIFSFIIYPVDTLLYEILCNQCSSQFQGPPTSIFGLIEIFDLTH